MKSYYFFKIEYKGKIIMDFIAISTLRSRKDEKVDIINTIKDNYGNSVEIIILDLFDS